MTTAFPVTQRQPRKALFGVKLGDTPKSQALRCDMLQRMDLGSLTRFARTGFLQNRIR